MTNPLPEPLTFWREVSLRDPLNTERSRASFVARYRWPERFRFKHVYKHAIFRLDNDYVPPPEDINNIKPHEPIERFYVRLSARKYAEVKVMLTGVIWRVSTKVEVIDDINRLVY